MKTRQRPWVRTIRARAGVAGAFADFDRVRQLSSYLLVLAGFSALLMTSAVGPFLAGIYVLVVTVSWRYRVELAPWVQVLLTGCLLAAFVGDWVFFSPLMEATIHLLMFASILKFFDLRAPRDYQLLFIISFTFLLIASTFTISIFFLASLVSYIFFANLTFILNESYAAFQENRTARFSTGGFIRAAALITGLVLVIAVPVFLAFPRGSLGLMRNDDIAGAHLSGFSDHVSLGDLGRIISDRRVFMRVRVEGAAPLLGDLKWRGIVLDEYDGQGWRNTEKNFRYVFKKPESRSFELARTRLEGERSLRQHFSMVGYSSVVFGAGRILQVFGIPGDAIQVDEHGTVSFFAGRPGEPISYVVDSGIAAETGWERHEMRLERLSEAMRSRYLQLPALDPRIPELARGVTASHGTALEKAEALERYLRQSFSYSLENESAGFADPLTHFLFVGKEGHCEYFATALGVMLRSLGIPSRVVNGFRSGEYNPWNQYFTVRHSDAHSWTEVYFPGVGWLSFDPTPIDRSPETFALLLIGRRVIDMIDLFWTEVVTFDRFKQVGFFFSVGEKIREVMEGFTRWGREIGRFLGRLSWGEALKIFTSAGLYNLCLALGGGLVLLVFRFRTRLKMLGRRWFAGREAESTAALLYGELLSALKSRGFVRGKSETPLEFAGRLERESASALPGELTRVYYQSRFGLVELSSDKIDRFRSDVRRLRDHLGRRRIRA